MYSNILKLLLPILLLFSYPVFGQSEIRYRSDDILSALIKSNTCGSVLYVAAHPDDENTRLLSYLAREKNYRTGYLSITRGDGGQNLIGKEQGDLLGLIRTQELLAARRVDGAEQFFTRACDFGYSKNPEETFSFWNKDSILSDVVFIIRKFRPDVIICRFPTTGEGGHGHHTASAILAEEAFEAAGDPERFSWQLAHVPVWQPARLFWNTFNFGTNNTTSPDQLKIDVGIFNPLLGKSHGEIAAESRSNHKSQGFGSAAIRGSSVEYFKQLKGETVSTDPFEGLNTSWSRLPGTATLQKKLEAVISDFNQRSPEKSVPALCEIRKILEALDTNDASVRYWKAIKLEENRRLLLACAGIWLEAYASDPVAVPGSGSKLKIQAVNRSGIPAEVLRITYPDADSLTEQPMKKNELMTWNHDFKVPSDIPYSPPYWLVDEHSSGLFAIDDLRMIGDAENAPAFSAKATVAVNGTVLECSLPVVYKSTDPVRGEVYRPVEVLPAVTVSTDERSASFFNGAPRTITVTLRCNTDSISGRLSGAVSDGWSLIGADTAIRFTKKGEEIRIRIIIVPGKATAATLRLLFSSPERVCSKGIRRIKYDHIPEQFYLPESVVRLRNIEIRKSKADIGYIEGAGDAVADCLEQAGYDVTVLDEDALEAGDLGRFRAIVTGVRAFNTEQNLIRFRSTLLDFVKNGGNLVVQYNTNNRLGPAPEKIGPYPFSISNQRVTDELSDVRFILPEHSSLKNPNTLSKDDFSGWIQERGIYFAASVDSNYVQPLGMNDPGEKETTGSLIIAPYGKGNFVYSGLSFFRELPAGVPGAYRLFINLIELPEHSE
jgi:LmbE family N-acetylglucosaminyl deacetylase